MDEAKLWELVGKVLYFPNGRIVGTVARYWSGREGDAYQSTVNGTTIHDPVLELEDGNSMLARAGMFVELTGKETAFYLRLQKCTQDFVTEMATFAAQQGMQIQTAMLLIDGVLGEASRACRMAGERGAA